MPRQKLNTIYNKEGNWSTPNSITIMLKTTTSAETQTIHMKPLKQNRTICYRMCNTKSILQKNITIFQQQIIMQKLTLCRDTSDMQITVSCLIEQLPKVNEVFAIKVNIDIDNWR